MAVAVGLVLLSPGIAYAAQNSPRQGPTDADMLLRDATGNWAAPRCLGDGVRGNRVQPVFVYRSGQPNRFASFATVLRRSLRLTTGIVERSSGGTRTVRWVQDAGTCEPTILQVAVPQRHTYNLVSIRKYLSRTDPRFSKRNRVYALWVDSYTSPSWSGLGGQRWSASWSSSFGFVWVDTHELMHALGAVSPNAPHASGHGHCWDGRDVMCYDDGGEAWRKVVICDGPSAHYRLDCGNDDYFAVAPRPGSWLSRNPGANLANSPFLALVAPRTLPAAPMAPSGVVRTATTVSWRQEPGMRYDVGYVGRTGNLTWLAQDLAAGEIASAGVSADRRIFVRTVNDAGVSARTYAIPG